MNCGNADHTEDCLCDVNIGDGLAISQYIDPIRYGFYGKELAHYMGLSRPYQPSQLVEFLAKQVELYEALQDASKISIPARGRGAADSKLSSAVQEVIAQMVVDGHKSRDIREHVRVHHGITVSQSHMSHLRKRLINQEGK